MAAAALLFAITRHVESLALTVCTLPWMPDVCRLSAGQAVVTSASLRLVGAVIPAGTKCVVVAEPAWDDDSCYTGREIKVEVREGPRRGDVVTVARHNLRVQ
jgi:hypothetical protein